MKMKLNRYEVLCCGGTYEIVAESWKVGSEGLIFYGDNKTIAWFTSFDYWIYKGEVADET